MSKQTYIEKTKAWISKFVIGYNLCPFAALPFKEDRIRYVVHKGEGLDQLVERIFSESFNLQNSEYPDIETIIVIHPRVLNDFDEYMAIFEQLEIDLSELKIEENIQLASFHPDYQFANTEPEDAENYTNRSPFPMVHILKAESVEKAIALHPDTEKIPNDNIKTMNGVGAEELKKQRNEIIESN